MVSTFIGLLDIQSWWEIPCISHFCSLFSSAFDLPDIDIEDLESALLSDGTDEIALVPELIVRLLKGCDALKSVAKEITHSNYQMFLRRFLRQQCRIHNTENHFDTDVDFQSLPVRNRLQILHDLCHFRLDSSDVQVILSNLEADSLRVEPLGYDSKNSGYWYFYGTRLYREDKPTSTSSGNRAAAIGNNGSVWQVICFTEEDWQNLASKLKSSTNKQERELYQILDENFLPKLPQLFRERERLRRRKLLQVRNSSRIRNIVELKARQEKERENRERQQRQHYQFEPPAKPQQSSSQSRTRRRSQSTSTASGISTYASSLRRTTTTNSSEFLCHRETFCLSPEDDEEEDCEPEHHFYQRAGVPCAPVVTATATTVRRKKDTVSLSQKECVLQATIKVEPTDDVEDIVVVKEHSTHCLITCSQQLKKTSTSSEQQLPSEQQQEQIQQNRQLQAHQSHATNAVETSVPAEPQPVIEEQNLSFVSPPVKPKKSHHKKKKSQKKQKKKSREHRRRHKHASGSNNDSSNHTNNNNKDTAAVPSSTAANSKTSSNNNKKSGGNKAKAKANSKSHQSRAPNKHHVHVPSLSPEDKENFCRQFSGEGGIAAVGSDLHELNPAGGAAVVAHNADVRAQTAVVTEPVAHQCTVIKKEAASIVHDMAPATIMKLPGRQTNNSLSSLTGNIFIPPTLRDDAASAERDNHSHSNNKSKASAAATTLTTTSTSGGHKKQKSATATTSAAMSAAGTATGTEKRNSGGGGGSKKKAAAAAAASSASTSSTSKAASSSQNSEKSADDFTETEEVLQIGMHKVLVYVKNHRDAWPFMDPVEEDIAPRYYSIIRRPMDLLKMEDKLDNGEYTKFKDFRNDFKLIVNNCRLYNGHNNEYTEMVNNLQEAFDKATKKYFDNLSEDEDDDPSLGYPAADSKMNVFREKYFNKKATKENENHNTSEVDKVSGQKSSEKKKGLKKHSVESAVATEGDEDGSAGDVDKDDDVEHQQRGTKRKRKEKDKRRKKKSKAKETAEKHTDNELEMDDEENIEKLENNEDNGFEHNTRKNKCKSKVTTKKSKKKSDKSSKSNKSSKGKNEVKSKKQSKKANKSKHQNSEESEQSEEDIDPETDDDEEDTYEPSAAKKSKTKPSNNESKTNTKATMVLPKKKTSSSKSNKQHSSIKHSKNKSKNSSKSKTKSSKVETIESDAESSSAEEKILKAKVNKDLPPPAAAALAASASELEEDVDDDEDSRSRSMSPFKVDLHKKYSKSALNDDLSELLTTVKKAPGGNICMPQDDSDEDDFKSLSSRSSSKSRHSSVDRETKRTPQKSRNVKKTETSPKNTNKTGSASNKKNAEMDAAALAAAEKQAELEMLLPFLDKYELIKYRRSRANNIQPTNTSTVADDSQKGTNNRSRESASKKKDIAKANDKEKLPTKSNNDQSKTRKTSKKTKKDVKDVKEATKPEDVVTASVTEEIPSTTSTSSTPEEKNNSKPVKPETKDDPEDLVDDSPTTTNTNTDKGSKSPDKKTSVGEKISVKKKDKPKTPPAPAAEVENTIKPVEKTVAPVPPKKALQKKVVASTSVNKKTGAKVAGSVVGGAVSGKNSSANIEALDVETEQTLKDINRWLEHTPRFPEFSSASNSPSRYNIDEFDSAISSKLEPSDFRRPVPIAAPKIDLGPTKLAEVLSDLVTDGETAVASGLKKDALSELNPAVGNAASVVVAGTASSVSSSCGTPPHSVASGNSMSSTSVIASSNNSSTTAQSIPTIAATNAVNQPIVLIPPPATVAPSLVPLAPPKPKEPSTTQLLLHPPPPPHIKNQLAKEAKRKTLKEKLQAASNPRRKDLLRTIDRLQPGKAKGNLIQNINKPEELFPLGPVAAKTKEVKNSLIVDTGDNVPKLSLGTVIKTNDFGLGQSHNFIDELASQTENKSIAVVGEKENEEKKNKADVLDINLPFTKSSSLVASITSAYDETEKKDAEVPSIDYVKPFESLLEKKLTSSTDASNGKAPKEKPNLSAWFKAFGAPKKSKKCEEEEKLMQQADVNEGSGSGSTKSNEGASSTSSTGAIAAKSPSSASMMGENFSLPSAPRQRKASTGSTISERSSFSQDPDSPRIAIDERYGSYSGANYTSPIGASPIGASPIMVSPKPDEIGKPTSPYPLNGAIKVGFYQDTTTKSSPDKSCSPREMTSPYPQYSQHIYSSASSPNVSTPELSGTSPYGGANSYNPSGSEASKTPVYSSTSPLPNLYEQYKQPRSQESDYNSSMSPSTPNPNSPYQQPQNSPYTAQPHQSPYHHPNSPYHQQQHSPFHQQAHSPAHTPPSGTAPTGGTSVHSPLQQQQHSPLPSSADSPSSSAATQPPTPLSNSPADQQHSPYQQPVQSPYQQQSQSTPTQQQQQQQHSPQSGQQSQQPQQQDARVQSPYSQSRISPLPYEPRAGTPESVIYDSQQQHDQAGIPTSRATTPTLVIQPMDQRYTQNTTNSSSGSASSRGSPMPTTPTYAPSPQDLFKQQQQTSQQDNLHTIYNASLAGASLTPIIDATKRNDWNVGAQPPQKQTQHHVTGGSQVQQQQSQQHSHQGQQQQQHQQTSQQQHSQSQSQQQQKPQYPTYALYQSKTAAAAQAAATPNREILVSAVGSSGSNSSSSNSSSDKLETNKNTASIYSGIGNIGTDVVAFMQHIHQQAAARQKSISAMVSVVATTGVNTPTTNVANSLKRSAEEMMSGMDYSSGSSAKIVKCENSGRENSGSIQQQLVVQTSKQQQMFDSFMGAMPFGKHLNNIATDKAFEMYSRAAALGFPKDYVKESSSCQMQRQLHQPNPNAAQNHQQQQTLQQLQQKQTQQLHQQQSQAHQQQQTHSPQHHQLQHHSQQQQQSQHQSKANLDSGATSLLNKPLNYGSSSLQQQQLSQQQQQQLSQSYSQQSSNQQQQHIAAKSPTPAAAHDNSGSMSMNMTTHHLAHSHHLSAYNKPTPPPPPPQTYNNPASSLLHPLAESMFGLPSSASYYDKSMPPAAHMYNAAGVAKNLSTTSQLYSNPATAAAAAAAATVAGGMYGNAQQLAGSYMGGSLANSSCSNNATNQQHSAVAVAMETKPTPAPPAPAKRGRKKKASTIAAEAAAAAAAAAKQQQHQQQQQQHQLQHSQQQQSHSQQQQQHASNHLHASSAPTQYSSAAAHIAAQMPTATTVQPAHQSSSVPAHLQAHAQTLQQGFQLYAGLKTGGVSSSLTNPASSASSASSVVASSAASPTAASTSAVSAAAASADVVAAISLKTSASAGMVPGSAFNFGPAPGSLGIYGDQAAAAAASSYLDQFREAPNPYYMSTAPAPAHRNSSNDASSVVEKAQSALNPAAAAATAASAYPFLAAHASSRATPYPFMNTAASQLDPNSQLYQPYLRREEFLMFNQGLLGRTAGAAGYVQPPPPAAYRPSTLGIPKPYDINRPAWF